MTYPKAFTERKLLYVNSINLFELAVFGLVFSIQLNNYRYQERHDNKVADYRCGIHACSFFIV